MIKKENLIFIEKAVRYPKVVEIVERIGNTIWHKIPDLTSFEHTCFVEIGKELEKGDVKSIEGLASYIVNRTAARHVNRSRYESPTIFSAMSSDIKNEGEDIEYEPEDVLANVEKEVLMKEMTDLLAQGDHRKKVIFGQWLNGASNYAEIARLLAQTLGGKEDTHRKAINRFRKECREIVESYLEAV